MKKYIIFFFLLFYFTSIAQKENLQIRTDTLYFPYQQGVQMIQIHYAYILENKISFKEAFSNYNYFYSPVPDRSGLIDCPTVQYVFRDTLGEIISTYNFFDKQEINKNELRSPHAVDVLDDSIALSFGKLFTFYYLDSIPAKKNYKIGVNVIGRYQIYGYPTVEYYGKKGLINRMGKMVLKPEYDDIFLGGKSPIVARDGKIGFLNPEGKPITPIKFQDIIYNSYGYIRNYEHHIVSVDSFAGIVDPYGNTLLDFKFKLIDIQNPCNLNEQNFTVDIRTIDTTKKNNDNFFYFITKEGKKGYMNARTFEYPISPDEYDYIGVSRYSGCQEFIIRRNGRYGYISKFEEVIPLEYDTIIKTLNHNYLARKHDFYGLYNSDFEMKLPAEYDTIIVKEYGFLVEKANRYGFFNNRFELKISIDCDTIIEDKMSFGTKNFITRKEGLYGVYNLYFKLQIPFEFDTIIRSFGEKYMVKKDGLYGLYGLDGNNLHIYLPVDFDTIMQRLGGYIVRKNKLYGFYDLAFNLKIPVIYHQIEIPIYNHSFYNYKSYYFIKKDSLFAIFDDQFEQVTKFKYAEITKVRSFFKVKTGEYYTILDSNLKLLCKPILKEDFEPLLSYYGNYYQKITTIEGKYGILGLESFFLQPVFDEIRFDESYKDTIYFEVRKGKRWKKIKVKPGE